MPRNPDSGKPNAYNRDSRQATDERNAELQNIIRATLAKETILQIAEIFKDEREKALKLLYDHLGTDNKTLAENLEYISKILEEQQGLAEKRKAVGDSTSLGTLRVALQISPYHTYGKYGRISKVSDKE